MSDLIGDNWKLFFCTIVFMKNSRGNFFKGKSFSSHESDKKIRWQ